MPKSKRPARWRKGDRVRWWSIARQQSQQVGTIVEPGRDSDLRQLVLWDGSKEPSWTQTARLFPEVWTVDEIKAVEYPNG